MAHEIMVREAVAVLQQVIQDSNDLACFCAAVLRVGFESHEARAIRRTSSMTDAA
jgi:hypothetical protein